MEPEDDISLEDLLASVSHVSTPPRKRTWAEVNIGNIPVVVYCLNCKTTHKTQMKARYDYFGKTYYQNTYYCPCCPVETDVKSWLGNHFKFD